MDDVRHLLAQHNIPAYSEMEIRGQKMTNPNQASAISNWFAETSSVAFSNLFLVVHNEPEIQHIMDAVEEYNQQHIQDNTNPLHAYQLDVDKAVG